ncbi:type VI secretion system ATPase TssH [Chelativorans sp. AA-79]|uniref:type VI secretion system ATPase TssH n=1 Tax=Chelativorans sp. AA-79 TaxID=3028735 RepID=UPI0023F637A7|nr:type VI secretion system ATPase TssH [Chelativorans sp. AA-79]WEX11972.1 type VI secretion system ATPase TssH [Chelativorans sp. AA-79]
MPNIDLERLIGALEPSLRVGLEEAASLAARNGHPAVEISHWMRSLLDIETVPPMLVRAEVDPERLRREVELAIEDLARGDGVSLTFSQGTLLLAREAWLVASLQYGRDRITFGDLLVAIFSEQSLRSLAKGMAPSLREMNIKRIETDLQAAGAGADETEIERAPAGGIPPGRNEFLRLYTQDMTADARAGRIDPVIGRECELRQVIDVLMRRRQNNPILVGEAGVGKTAIAEALALAIAAGDVPEILAGVRLLSLDLSLLQAGAGVKGEFERRLHGVIDAVKEAAEPIILFIDEAHSLIGGGQAGTGDAANILKPSLARGELRTIAATTWSEYKRFIERDAALTRRFQMVKVHEPDEVTAIRMLRGLADAFAAHHGVRIRDEALAAAVRLSARYIPARQLPDKAISLIDTAAASVALARQSQPEALRALRSERDLLATEASWLVREPATEENRARALDVEARRKQAAAEIEAFEARYDEQMRLVGEADRLEALFSPGPDMAEGGAARGAEQPGGEFGNVAVFPARSSDAEQAREALAAAERELSQAAGETLLVPRVVDRDVVASLVARWTGIPVGKLLSDQVDVVKGLDGRLKERVIGQDAALGRIATSMRTARAGLSDPRRPPAVFLLVGTSGTGKTETALALADLLYGGRQSLTIINMSEFKEEHKVSMLLGSPPGYVGYGEGGVLTEAVRRRPYGVLLLDEIDKAHPGVQEIFYQVFDKGTLRDGEGRDVDFKNTTILMTANTGAELLYTLAADPDTMPEGAALEKLLLPELRKHFKPAFLGRTTMVPFLPLGKEALSGIVDIQIGRIADRIRLSYATDINLLPEARAALVSRAETSEMGARAIESMIARDLLPSLSTFFLDAVTARRTCKAVEIGFDGRHFSVVPARLPRGEEFVKRRERATNKAAPDEENDTPDAASKRKAGPPRHRSGNELAKTGEH